MRNFVFWTLDFLKGSRFRKHLNEINKMQNGYNATHKQREKLLSDLLEFCIKEVPYYKDFESSNFQSFPVINKNIVRDQFSRFQSNKFSKNELHKVATSGSTGTPFTTFLNDFKKIRNSADTIYFAEKAGFKIGDQLIYIRLWDQQHKKGKLGYWIKNIISHDISKLTDSDIESLLHKIKTSNQRIGLLGYSSAFDSICKYLDKIDSKPIVSKVCSIIAISEGLSEYARDKIPYYFDCPIVSRYSASETGIIAQQVPNNSYFEINWASYFVEVLDLQKDIPVPLGTLGRIVITDLFNYAVPLIRYDTGDLGVLNEVEGEEAPVLSQVEGRKMDMLYTTSGELITSHIVHQICLFEGIEQYQLIQKSEKEYVFKINAVNFKEEEALISIYKDYLGSDANISIEYVNNIPLLSSGKRKKVLNEYY